MFYCNACATRAGWPESERKSHGPCEVCRAVGVCNDVPAYDLPDSPMVARMVFVEPTFAEYIRARNPRFTLTIDMGGAAFADDPEQLATLLDKIALSIVDPFRAVDRVLIDSNGNTCGRLLIEIEADPDD